MRHVLISVLLGLPMAAIAQEDPPATQGQDEQQAQQSQQQDQQSQDSMQTQPISTQQQQPQQAQQQQGQGEAEVARAQFTSEVQDREPVDEVSDEFQAGQEPLFFFTEVKNAAGQTVTHRWKHDGEVMAEVPLQVGSDSWRTWSSKELMPEWEGEWTVEVVDAQGNTLTEESINVESSQQTQNVGYSPDEQEQQTQQTSGEDTVRSRSGEQSSGSEALEPEEEDGEWQTDSLPEEVDYEQQQSQDDMESQDDTQQQDDQGGVGEDY